VKRLRRPRPHDGAPTGGNLGPAQKVFDPEIPVNIVDLGLVYSMEVEQLPDAGGYRVNIS